MEFAHLTTTAGEDWERWAGRNLEVNNDALGLATEPSIDYTNLRIEGIDISVDRDGTIFILEESGDIKRYQRGDDESDIVWENGAGASLDDPRALCVVGDRILMADGESGDLLLYSRREESVEGQIAADLIEPVDVIMSDRRIFILDAGDADHQGRVLTLRRNGMLEAVVRGLDAPTDISADSTHLYIIEHPEGEARIRIHDVGHLDSPSIIPTGRTVEELHRSDTDDPVIPVRIEVLTDQELIVIGRPPDGEALTLYHYTLDHEGETLERRDDFPIQCRKVLTGPRDQNRRYPMYYAIAGEQNHVYIIDERQTNRRNPVEDRYSAQAVRRLDSGAIDTGWNRLTLDLENFPANTQVVTSYFATNERLTDGTVDDLSAIDDAEVETLAEAGIEGVWDLLDATPAELAEITGHETTDEAETWHAEAMQLVDEAEWTTTDSANQWDILLEEVEGRYLHVRLELIGGISASPTIDTFRAYCPKRSYLRYLPEHYRRKNVKSQFLEQYLAVFESEFTDIEEDIESIDRYFDPDGVPNEYLSWLGRWLAVEFDEEWPAGAKREFLRDAARLFKLRGTRDGLNRTIDQYLSHVEAPDTSWMTRWQKRRIHARQSDGMVSEGEADRLLQRIEDLTLGHDDGHLVFFFEHKDFDDITSPGARDAYSMHLNGPRSYVAYVGPFVSETHRSAVERIVGNQGPAHTAGSVVEIRQELKLEGSSFLGINSTLTTREFVLGRSTLGGDTVLTERDSMV